MGVTVAVTRVAANTGTGTQDITTTDLGGLTPKGAILIATRCVTDGTAADGAGFYIGFTDGTNHANSGVEDKHASASSVSSGTQDTSSPPLLIIYDGAALGTIEGSANFSAWITNGIRIDWTDAPAGAYLITAIFFAGTDLSAACLVATDLGNTTDGVTDITSIGFEADVVIVSTLDPLLSGGNRFGLIHNNRLGTVTQRVMAQDARSGIVNMSVRAVVRTDACAVTHAGNGSLDWYGEAGSFDSSGFSVTTRNSGANGADICGLALRFGTSPVVSSKVYTYSTPTAPGANTDSTPNFTPQFVMYLTNRAAVAATLEEDADGGASGVLVVDADDLYTNSVGSEDAAADSNTQSLSDDRLNLPTHTGADGHIATLTSLGSTGPVWNYSATDATARLWPALAIGIFSEEIAKLKDMIGDFLIPIRR